MMDYRCLMMEVREGVPRVDKCECWLSVKCLGDVQGGWRMLLLLMLIEIEIR
jgi:hypothetical protein